MDNYEKACQFFAENGNISNDIELIKMVRPSPSQLSDAALYAIKVKKCSVAEVSNHVTVIYKYWETIKAWNQKDLIQLALLKEDIARATRTESFKKIADELSKKSRSF